MAVVPGAVVIDRFKLGSNDFELGALTLDDPTSASAVFGFDTARVGMGARAR